MTPQLGRAYQNEQYNSRWTYSSRQPFLPLLDLSLSFCPITGPQVHPFLYLKHPWRWTITFTPKHYHKGRVPTIRDPRCFFCWDSSPKEQSGHFFSAPKWMYLVPLNLASVNIITMFPIISTLPWLGHVTPGVCICVSMCMIWWKRDTFGHVCNCHLYLPRSIFAYLQYQLMHLTWTGFPLGTPGNFFFFFT